MKKICFAMLLVAGMACLGEVSAAEPMELRVYPVVPACVERMSLDDDAEITLQAHSMCWASTGRKVQA